MKSGLDPFDKSMFVMSFLTILGVTEISSSFRLVLEWKASKQIPESSRLEFSENILANNFAFSDAEDNNSGLLNGEGIADLPLFRTLSNLLKVLRAKFLKSDRLFCFTSICKFGNANY